MPAADLGLPLHQATAGVAVGPPSNRGRLVDGLADVDEFLDVFPTEGQVATGPLPEATAPPSRPSAWMLDAEPMEVCLPDGEVVTVWVELGLSHEARTAIAENLARTFRSDAAPDITTPTAHAGMERREAARASVAARSDATAGSSRRSRQRSTAGSTAAVSRPAAPRAPRKRTRGPLLAAQ